ncbi:Uncharacterised protein [Streptococcus canis]|uniref:Uncharacterized protein n=1 Tax=Streptococcus canis TaxID=1329 RepID=A0AAE4Q7U7_STRCB|nr:hypothetical protein [Streptococcus canis]MDV5978081.1 hypothetical protein [Streptococcus canis]VTS75397.1 Uncharacterised protein [Streptococcus canis]GAY70491.1 uncharacterized protein TANIYAMA4_0898 [Streptococcus canis]GAY71728.1 uncharacterized protein TANIYAMA4_2372 [Streptococcus canis]GFE45964.1 hypothetical protein ScFU6_17330 [Streptococcus canis]
MSRDKTRIRSIVKSMKQLGASKYEIDEYMCLYVLKKPHVIAQIRKKAKIFRSEGW